VPGRAGVILVQSPNLGPGEYQVHAWTTTAGEVTARALGAFTLELSAGVFFFTINDEYYGGTTLEQEPLYTTQVHVTYSFRNGVWAALDATYDFGGRTTVDGVQKNDEMENSRFGVTLAMPVNRNYSIKLYASSGVSTRTGSDYKIGGMALQYRW